MTKTKSVEQTYQVLSDIDHVRHRPGMYVGSINADINTQWVYNLETQKMQRRDLSVIPAFVKIFSEIIDNAIDEYKRAPKEMTTIKVDLNKETGVISVQDNGRGFPCKIHGDTGKYVVETVFTNLRAGSNFDDSEDAATVGQNGLGATLTVILSTAFTVETADSHNMYKQTFSDGMKTIGKAKITDSTKHGTTISFKPDYEYFKLPGLDQDHYDRLVKRIVDSAACNPGLKFYINGTRIDIKNFNDYVEMYLDEGDAYVSDLTGDWAVAVSKATDGYEQISFVNSVETYGGGEHVKYATNQIVDELRAFIKKKHKVDVSPGDIRNHMRIYISAVVNRPRFSSQTKENMISLPSEWKTTWSVPERFISKLVKTDIIQNILDWAQAKADAALKAELRKVGKEVNKADPRRVNKFSDAMERNERNKCVLFLSEGDTLEENTPVITFTGERFEAKPLREVKTGDMVLTHNNRMREVLSTSPKVIEGVVVKYEGKPLTISPEHRMIVYDTKRKKFLEVKAKDLKPGIHKLVRNKLASILLAATPA